MLNKGVRDEKKVKIDNMLSTLLSLVFVPKFWNIEDTSLIDNQLTDFDLTTTILNQIEEKDLISLLDKYWIGLKKNNSLIFWLLFPKRIHLI